MFDMCFGDLWFDTFQTSSADVCACGGLFQWKKRLELKTGLPAIYLKVNYSNNFVKMILDLNEDDANVTTESNHSIAFMVYINVL